MSRKQHGPAASQTEQQPWGAVTTSAALVATIALASGGVLLSKNLAEDLLRSESLLNSIVSEVRFQDGLEWRAISGQETGPIRAQLIESHGRVETLLGNTSGVGLRPPEVDRLDALHDRYAALVLKEIDLLDADQISDSEKLDEEQVDPAAAELLDTLAISSTQLRERNASLARWSDFGVVLSVALAFLAMAWIQYRFHRKRSRLQAEVTSDARHRVLIEQSADLVMVCDRHGRFIYLSPAAERVLAPPGENRSTTQLGNALDHFVHAEDVSALRTALSTGSANEIVVRLAHPDRISTSYHVAVRDLTANPAVAGMVLTFHDVTEMFALDQAKNGFIANVSHELRTPLTSIRGYLELLREGELGELVERQLHALSVVDRNAVRLLGLVDELLLLSDMSDTRPLDHSGPVDLAVTVQHASLALSPVAAQGGVALDIPHAAQAWVAGDREKLERLVVNLLSNAIKFTRPGGEVTIDLSVNPASVLLTVSDTGIGIPVEEQGDLFKSFFRSSSSMLNEIPGTGLGLALCRSIVEVHAGEITLQSEPGVGTCVTVTLPRLEDVDENATHPLHRVPSITT